MMNKEMVDKSVKVMNKIVNEGGSEYNVTIANRTKKLKDEFELAAWAFILEDANFHKEAEKAANKAGGWEHIFDFRGDFEDVYSGLDW